MNNALKLLKIGLITYSPLVVVVLCSSAALAAPKGLSDLNNVSGQTLEITGTVQNQPVWEDNGSNSGTCYLNCHGVVHDGWSY